MPNLAGASTLTNDLILDGGQQRPKPRVCKAKPNHILKAVFSPRLVTVYQVVGYMLSKVNCII